MPHCRYCSAVIRGTLPVQQKKQNLAAVISFDVPKNLTIILIKQDKI